jgi:hypothetical protein
MPSKSGHIYALSGVHQLFPLIPYQQGPQIKVVKKLEQCVCFFTIISSTIGMHRRTYVATTAALLSLGGCTAPDINDANTSIQNRTSAVTSDTVSGEQRQTVPQPDSTPTHTVQETTPQRTPSEVPLKINYDVDEVKQNATTVDYSTLIENIDKYIEKPVYYEYADVYRVIPSEASSQIQMRVSTTAQEWQGVIDGYLLGDEELTEGDIIQFWGFVRGFSEFETVQGNSRIVPSIQVVDYKL